MHCSAIVLTGGCGSRMKEIDFPKQFCEVLGKPVFVHTLETYEDIDEINDIYLVINAEYTQRYEEILSCYQIKKLRAFVPGGETRQDSVEQGVLAIIGTDIVIIQEGVNPTTHPDLIRECIKVAKTHGVSTACAPANHTVFTIVNKEVDSIFERNGLYYAAAPQAYQFQIIKEAMHYARIKSLTNRPILELVKKSGYKIVPVLSKYENVKITTDKDLITVEGILRKRERCQTSA